MLSPHTETHTDAENSFPPEQINPGSLPEQSDLQLTVSVVLPSSQTSEPTHLASPHMVWQVYVGAEPVHVQPTSTLQMESHPSPFKVLPCSQDSD